MAKYKKFFIQQQTYNGITYTSVGDNVDTFSKFNVVCQEMPFKYLPETKDLPKRDWHDEDGEDVYVPADGQKFKAYDTEAKFLYVGTEQNMASDLKSFIDFVCGRTNVVSGSIVSTSSSTKNVLLKVYDQYTQIEAKGLYVLSVDNNLFLYNNSDAEAIAQFGVKFRVTDPIASIVYTESSSS